MLADQLADKLLQLLRELEVEARAELRAQGHVATGRGLDSIEGVVTEESVDRLVGCILAEDYLVGPVDKGVKAKNIPFGGRQSSGGRSQYIQGLLNWIRIVKPSLSDQERKSFAFAIANKQRREGMPTRGSFAFSNNGRRTGWIKNGIAKNEQKLVERLRLFSVLQADFDQILEQLNPN